MKIRKDIKIGVIGLGYVGLPLSVEFGKKYDTIGYDINQARINDLRNKVDRTREVPVEDLASSRRLVFTNQHKDLADCNYYIVTVPTPIDDAKRPDLGPLLSACETIGSVLKHGDIVVFESTVYPGATEEVCVPVLEKISGLSFNIDFYCGYSPERINPGDHGRRITSITKVTSGSTPDAANAINDLYSSIIAAGTHLASSIAVAEAAKVIENTQRDLNIALVNELSIIFNRIGIDTSEVLAAASTKWNFLPFAPGLVGGHCIGVDPYYLTYKSEAVGYHPHVILSGRRINDGMGEYVASCLVKCMVKRSLMVVRSRVLVMGLTFKENCPDIRNTKVVDVVKHLQDYGAQVDVFDPWVEPDQVLMHYGLAVCSSPSVGYYDAIILAVAHDEFRNMGSLKIREFGKDNHVFFDLKSVFAANESDLRL
ncbi:Vi polysaccharide biosynthesis UDP-N-acetylglucosamine C-6 dehydrogenase TviB [Paracoccaceae bacterium]|nr:Vi polysaccharide biosynthesis UDP-N-acetylglucosamine C-6 dehydrogenase TviB [Paracoccaceae bacterium]